MLTLITTAGNQSCVPEACRGRNPPTILQGITHSSTHSVQKKTRNGYDNCSDNCLTNKIGFIMRKETNAQFVNFVNANDAMPQVLVDAIRFTRNRDVQSVDEAGL